MTYAYDTTNQLTADGSHTFTFDGTGNRNNGSYGVTTGNQITTDGTWTYTFDAEGNLTKKSKGASLETWTYGYDNKNELTSAEDRVTDGGTLLKRVDYKYDAMGDRIQTALDNNGDGVVDSTTRYAVDGWKTGAMPQSGFIGNENFDVWADLDGQNSNALATRYVRGSAIDQVFARIGAGGSAYWLLPDRQGSIRDVQDNSPLALKDTIVYDGWGNISSETDSTYRGRYAWTGRELDTETGLQYNRARYYDSKTGRWISQDPLGFDAGDSNLYRYLRNQFVVNSDPSGLQDVSSQDIVSDLGLIQIAAYIKSITHENNEINSESLNLFAPRTAKERAQGPVPPIPIREMWLANVRKSGRQLADSEVAWLISFRGLDNTDSKEVLGLLEVGTKQLAARPKTDAQVELFYRLARGFRQIGNLAIPAMLVPQPVSRAGIDQAIADLGSGVYKKRDFASRYLQLYGGEYLSVLRRALMNENDRERERRLQTLVTSLQGVSFAAHARSIVKELDRATKSGLVKEPLANRYPAQLRKVLRPYLD